jgi:hypothetical protein
VVAVLETVAVAVAVVEGSLADTSVEDEREAALFVLASEMVVVVVLGMVVVDTGVEMRVEGVVVGASKDEDVTAELIEAFEFEFKSDACLLLILVLIKLFSQSRNIGETRRGRQN